MKKVLSIVIGALILSMLLIGCGDSDGASGGKDSLNFGLPGEPTTLDPTKTGDEYSRTACYQIYDYLIKEQKDNTLGPGLAERWEYNDDKTELTFHLREDVKFHNGDIMTAEDVAFSLNTVIASDFATRVTSAMDSAEVLDENTVVLKLKHAFGPAEHVIATSQMGILNKKAYEADPEGYGRKPIGTGAYEFVEWNTGEDIKLKAFEDYWQGEAAIKDLTFRILPDANTRAISLETGETDFAININVADMPNIRDHEDLTLYENESTAVVYIAMNNEHEILSNKKVRQALAHVLNKEEMILGVLDGNGSPLETPMSKGAFGWPEDFKNREHDIEKAKELMVEAGYPDGFEMTFLTSELEDHRKRAEIFQDQAKEIGIDFTIESLEWGAYLETTYGADYAITSFSITTPYTDSDHIYELYHSDMFTKGRNFVRSNNPELDRLLDEGRTSVDPADREKIYRDICELWKEECFTVPILTAQVYKGGHKELKGVVPLTLIGEYNVYYFSW